MSSMLSTLQAPSHLQPGKAMPVCGLAVQTVRHQLLHWDWQMSGTFGRCQALCRHVRRLLSSRSAYECYNVEVQGALHEV